jgi:hypothetical protein
MGEEIKYLPEARRLMRDYPRWDVWTSIKAGTWHARLKGATPPVMFHDDNPTGLRDQIERQVRGEG